MLIIKYYLLLLTTISLVQSSQTDLLGQLRWKHRILLLEYKAEAPDSLNKQLELLASLNEDYSERKLLVIKVSDKEYTILNPDHMIAEVSASGRIIRAATSLNFEVSLIGLDGTEKYKSPKPISKSELFERIDRMPMRQSEIKGN